MDDLFENEAQVLVLPKKYLRIAGVALVGIILFGYIGLSAYFGDKQDIAPAKAELQQPQKIMVELAGAVISPGVYAFETPARIADLLTVGGGLSQDADAVWIAKNVNLSTPLADAQKVYIPFEWEQAGQQSVQATIQSAGVVMETQSNQTTTPVSTSAADMQLNPIGVNVNSASQSELEELVGIGKVYAQRIIDNRPYLNLQDLAAKTGIPSSTLDKNATVINF